MSIQEKADIIEELEFLDDPEERLQWLIDQGKKADLLTDEERIDNFIVKGCMSQLWLVPSFENGKVFFKADSDAMIPKGLASVITRVYNGMTPDEITAEDASFLSEYGIEQHLSMNRRNGLSQICKQIQLYAHTYKQLS
ncbi:MAG: SufE family protein [Lentisphaeria bacterium]|nr:SufE family protein [Lentisphaeria bacterium]